MHKIDEPDLIFFRFWGFLAWLSNLRQFRRFLCLGRVSRYLWKWQLCDEAWPHTFARQVYRCRRAMRSPWNLYYRHWSPDGASSSSQGGTSTLKACTAEEERWLDGNSFRGSSRCHRRGRCLQDKVLKNRGIHQWVKIDPELFRYLSPHKTWLGYSPSPFL